jgi:hypothetical protein
MLFLVVGRGSLVHIDWINANTRPGGLSRGAKPFYLNRCPHPVESFDTQYQCTLDKHR